MSLLLAFMLAQSTKKVEFTYSSSVHHKSVTVAGTFNNWNKDANPLSLGSDGLTWTTGLSLSPGKHQYKFVLDGDNWVTDPKAVKNEDDGNGNINSVLLVLPPGYEKPAAKGDGTITFEAVKHVQEVPDLNWDRGYLTLTVQARTNDVARVSLFCFKGDSASPVVLKMAEKPVDEFSVRYTARVPWDRARDLRYSFQFDDGGRGPLTLDKSGAWYMKEAPLKGDEDKFVLGAKSFKPFQPPAWVENAVIYQIFPDRFANGDKTNDPQNVVAWDGKPEYDNFFGGDFAGVRGHLDYLKGLGANCVYFNPIFEGPSNHRYEATDFKKIDHRLGTNTEFADLTQAMDGAGIKTVLDGVFNHTAVDFFAFDDILKNQKQSKYLNWYTVKSFPVSVSEPPPYEAWFGFKSMPKLNNSDPSVRDYLLSVPDFWDKTAKIAGWRLDVANEVPADYWRLFRQRVKGHGADKWIVGEFWGDASQWLKGDQWDSVMNYQFRNSVLGFVAQGKTTPTQYWNSLMRTYDSYGPQVSRNMMNLLGSHDTSRILNECGKDPRLARLAAMLQFTWVGAPSVYYGDELGMEGDRDPDNRRGMRWDKVSADNPYLVLYKQLTAMRKGDLALRSGDPELVSADDLKKTLVFSRKVGAHWTIVAVNRGSSSVTQSLRVPLQHTPLNITTFSNDETSVNAKSMPAKAKANKVTITVEPLSMTVVSNAPATGSATRESTRTTTESQQSSASHITMRHRK